MEKKNVVFLTVLAIATLLTAVVGTTFAYFTATVTGNTTATTTTVTSATLGVTYSDGADISATNIVPGWTASKTISVKNDSTVAVTYDISWTNLTNSFVQGGTATKTDDFVYTLTKTSTNGAANVTETAVPTVTDTKLITGQSIAAGETQSYTLTITFKDTGIAQNENQGKKFITKLQTAVANVSK
jgi:hypothetical protein